MKKICFVETNSKDAYKKAICDACDDLKTRVDDILCDFEKHLREITITIKVGFGEVSVINITKEMCVEGGDENEKG